MLTIGFLEDSGQYSQQEEREFWEQGNEYLVILSTHSRYRQSTHIIAILLFLVVVIILQSIGERPIYDETINQYITYLEGNESLSDRMNGVLQEEDQ